MRRAEQLGAYGCTLLAAAGLLAALVFVGVTSGANSASYPDPTGDAGAAADVTSVNISNDDAGVVTFELNFANRPTFTNGAVSLYLDSDGNSGTGTVGSDYRMRWYANDSQQFALERWNGSSWAIVTPSSFSSSSGPNRMTFSVNRADIGTTTSLNFYVFTAEGGNDYVPDSAVSGARASYAVIIAPPGTGTTPTPRPPTIALPDTDGDKLPDVQDACPMKAAGSWDPNGNGCAGPFSGIDARLSFQLRVSPLQFNQLRVRGVPFNGVVELRLQGVLERLRGSGSVSSRKLLGDPVAEGAVLELRVSKPGWVGYYARLRVSSNGVKIVMRRCLPPTGGRRPVRCGASLWGK